MLDKLKTDVFNVNIALKEQGLAIMTWGNASGIDRKSGLVVIKPSGVPYDKMRPDDMVVVDMEGEVVEGIWQPSSDTLTHLVLYRNFHGIGGIVHTHARWTTCWAQAGRGIPVYGTTHADYFFGEVPCTRPMVAEETEKDYELNTGKVIVECFSGTDPMKVPGVVVHAHAPFTWGTDVAGALESALVLEEIAEMAFRTEMLGNKQPVGQHLLNRHYLRKHGKDAYYGQKKKRK
jgi:L-ribulose-5-phosphate 4-epimerase